MNTAVQVLRGGGSADLGVPAPALRAYLANLAALYAVDPELAGTLERVPFAELPHLEPTRDGHWTARVVGDDGRAAYVHSRYRPLEEARTAIEAQVAHRAERPAARESAAAGDSPAARASVAGAEAAPDSAFEAARLSGVCFLVAGIGLGYHLGELERRFEQPLLIVAEDDLRLLKAALCVTDLSGALREQRVTILTAADKAQVHQRLRSAMTNVLLGLTFITLPHTARCHAAFHAAIRGLIRDFITYSRVQMFSLLRLARLTAKNIAFNLADYVGHSGVEVLRNRAAGKPAILVAAGPSLARNIDQLGVLRDRAVIIAAQTVFKTLLARGIRPHFVCSLDFHELSGQFFDGLADTGGATLVAEPKAHWRVLDAYRGPRHVLHSDIGDSLLRELALPRTALRAGCTVAHLAFYLAEHLGCDPVILIGHDLSFTEALYYPPGTQIERIWQPELGRFMTIENKQWERIARGRPSLVRVRDIHGRETYTEDTMYVYAEQFQSDFLLSRVRVIQATEGGMALSGTEIMPLRKAAERYCRQPLPADLFAAREPAPAADLGRRACASVESRLSELREIRAIAAETLDVLGRLSGLLDRPVEFNRLVGRVDELRARMRRNDRTYQLVSLVSQMAELRRVQADRAIRDGGTETPAKARRRLQRDREYVAAFLDGCDYLLEILPPALERLRARFA